MYSYIKFVVLHHYKLYLRMIENILYAVEKVYIYVHTHTQRYAYVYIIFVNILGCFILSLKFSFL